jgi:hypothetical protein
MEEINNIFEREFLRIFKANEKLISYYKELNLIEVDFDGLWEPLSITFSFDYNKLNSFIRVVLEKEFNIKDVIVKIKDENITHKIRSLNDAINALGEDDLYVVKYKKMLLLDLEIDVIAYQELKIITKALNEGWEPDWTDDNQRKWYSWFRYDPSVSRFVFNDSGYVYWLTLSGDGSRLCYKEESLAAFAANRFPQIYNNYLILNK